MPAPTDDHDVLSAAYEQRSAQLYDARMTLAAAVAALTTELAHQRAQLDQALSDNRALREQEHAMRRHEAELATRVARLEAELEVVRNMKVVRWTKWPRSIVYRIRARRR